MDEFTLPFALFLALLVTLTGQAIRGANRSWRASEQIPPKGGRHRMVKHRPGRHRLVVSASTPTSRIELKRRFRAVVSEQHMGRWAMAGLFIAAGCLAFVGAEAVDPPQLVSLPDPPAVVAPTVDPVPDTALVQPPTDIQLPATETPKPRAHTFKAYPKAAAETPPVQSKKSTKKSRNQQ